MRRIILFFIQFFIKKSLNNNESRMVLSSIEGKSVEFFLTDMGYRFLLKSSKGLLVPEVKKKRKTDLKIYISLRELMVVLRKKESLERLFLSHSIRLDGDFSMFLSLASLF